MEHLRVATNGITLHVAVDGPADGPVVLLLHGFPESHLGWCRLMPRLAAMGYRVLAPDQRGYGLSDKPTRVRDYRLATLADDATGLLDAFGVDRAAVVAHDWGGAVGWWLALDRPERVSHFAALNIPHPSVFKRALLTPRQLRKSWYMLAFQVPWLAERFLTGRRLEGAMFANSTQRPFTEAEVEAWRAGWAQPGAVTAMLAWYRAGARYPPSNPRFATVSCPSVLVWGTQDTALGAEMAQPSADRLDHGVLVRVETAGHFVQHDAPDVVADQVLALLARGAPPGRRATLAAGSEEAT